MATGATSLHWPEYLVEAGAIGTSMVSAAVFTALLYHPASPISDPHANALRVGDHILERLGARASVPAETMP